TPTRERGALPRLSRQSKSRLSKPATTLLKHDARLLAKLCEWLSRRRARRERARHCFAGNDVGRVLYVRAVLEHPGDHFGQAGIECDSRRTSATRWRDAG